MSIVEVVVFYYFIKVLVEVSKIQLFYKCTYRDCTASAMEAAMLDDKRGYSLISVSHKSNDDTCKNELTHYRIPAISNHKIHY